MTAISIESPDFLSSGALSDEEAFIQNYSWTPQPPKNEFISTSRYFGIEKSTFIPVLPFKTMQVNECGAKLFGITAWFDDGSFGWVNGLSLHQTEFPARNLSTIGATKGAALDFRINAQVGEFISSLKVYYFYKSRYDHGMFMGLQIVTNIGRCGLLRAAPIERLKTIEIKIPAGSYLRGFYGLWQTGRNCTFLSSLGILISPTPEKNFPDIETPSHSMQKLGTARVVDQDAEFPRSEWWADLVLRGGTGQYSSVIDLTNCRTITCYARHIPHFRLVGMRLEYNIDNLESQKTEFIGQISLAEPLDEVLYFDEDESFTKVRISVAQPPSHPMPDSWIIGLNFWLSSGREFSWGQYRSHRTSKEHNIMNTTSLRWDFNRDYDILRVVEA
ncbi:hypothetical protein TWF694_010027 [Orbilia ellipsospora]|uniref:Uncharacterized protein n=1 Tax=Orbilia ellipsospora TaxID=2528407 RepID=A0AAV9X8Q5_9PEZI